MTRDEWDRRGELLAAAGERAEASRPKCCPECGAPDPVPTFDPIDRYECPACGHTWHVSAGDKEEAS